MGYSIEELCSLIDVAIKEAEEGDIASVIDRLLYMKQIAEYFLPSV